MEVSGQLHALATLPQGRDNCTHPLRSWVVPRDSMDRFEHENLSPLPGFKPQTVQPVASHYIAYVILVHFVRLHYKIFVLNF